MSEGNFEGLQNLNTDTAQDQNQAQTQTDLETLAEEPERSVQLKKEVEVADTGGDSTWVYFKDLGRFKILSREQEVKVAQRIENNKIKIKEIIFSSLAVLDRLTTCQIKLMNKEIRLEDIVSPETCRWFAPENIKREKSKVLSRLKKINKLVAESNNSLNESSDKVLKTELLQRYQLRRKLMIEIEKFNFNLEFLDNLMKVFILSIKILMN